MENVVFTQLSISEIRKLFRQELETYFTNQPISQNYLNSEKLLTIKEAGKILNLTVPTLYGYVQRAEIPVCKKGNRLYFTEKELTEWIKQGRKKTISETEIEPVNYLKKKGGKNE